MVKRNVASFTLAKGYETRRAGANLGSLNAKPNVGTGASSARVPWREFQ